MTNDEILARIANIKHAHLYESVDGTRRHELIFPEKPSLKSEYYEEGPFLAVNFLHGEIVKVVPQCLAECEAHIGEWMQEYRMNAAGDAEPVDYRPMRDYIGLTETPSAVRAYMASIGAKGGAATTEAKTAAARENGKKGGRPRKEKPSQVPPPKEGDLLSQRKLQCKI